MLIKNYIYNLMYQIINIIVPIITIPYISRILGADGIGQYALSNTIAQYFAIWGMLGLSIYSSREIAFIRDDFEKLNRTFWELNFIRFITIGFSIVIYFIFVNLILPFNKRILFNIQGIVLFSYFFDISWFFIGLEDFKKISLRNIIVKMIGVILIFLLIKNENQVNLYALILVLSQFFGQIIMWINIKNIIKFRKPKLKNMIKHLRLSIKLFIPQIAMTVYTMLDKVMLGLFSNDFEVGLYDNSQKIIRLLSIIVTSVTTVMLPKMANLYGNKKREEFKNNVYKTFSITSFIAFPISFGLFSISDSLVPWFYGAGFNDIKSLLHIGSFLLVTLGWSSILGNQVLISTRKENEFTISVVCGAIINIILNFILIRILKGNGAMIASILAEYIGMLLMLYFCRNIIKIRILFKGVFKYAITSLFMCIIVYCIGIYLGDTMLVTFFQVIVGIVIYISILLVLRDKNLYFCINFIKSKIFNK